MLTFYVHKMTVRYTDYGSPLGTSEGVCWSRDGVSTFGFERGQTVASKLGIASERPDLIEVFEGRPVERTCDMNPHGFI